jgi:DNA-binding GntR family transcriptional regulator
MMAKAPQVAIPMPPGVTAPAVESTSGTQFEAAPVDPGIPVPLYYQIEQSLEAAIIGGALPQGSRLESELDLARRFGVSRPTIRRAIEHLSERGLVIRRRGIGTIVTSVVVRRALALTSLYDDLTTAGQEPTTKVLRFERQPCPQDVADSMRIAPGTEVIYFERLRLTLNKPLGLMHNFVPVDLVGISRESLEQTGFYRLLERSRYRLCFATQAIGARAADGREARLLQIEIGAPVLTVERTSFDESTRVIEYGSHIYRADSYRVEVQLVSK